MTKTQIAMIFCAVLLGGIYALSFIPAMAGWGYPGYRDTATSQTRGTSGGSYYRGGSSFFFFSGGNGQVFQEAPSVRRSSVNGPSARGAGLSRGK